LVAAITRTSTVSSQHAQQLHLRGRRHLGDLVEEQRAAIGQLEAAGPSIDRAGEGAFFVPEDLALEQRFGNGGAVDRDKWRRRTGTELMDRLRDELLARTRFAPNQHRRRGRRRLLDDLIHLAHLRAAANHAPEAAMFAQLFAQGFDFAERILPLDDLVEQNLEPLRLDRLGQVVVGAFLDRLDRGFDAALRCEDDDRVVAAVVFERAQEIETAHPRHHQVADDDRGAEHGDALQRLFAVGGGIGRESPGAYELCQTESSARLVFDDENAFS
jgi:hypothetical protein